MEIALARGDLHLRLTPPQVINGTCGGVPFKFGKHGFGR